MTSIPGPSNRLPPPGESTPETGNRSRHAVATTAMPGATASRPRSRGWFAWLVLALTLPLGASAARAQPPAKDLDPTDWTPLMRAARSGDFPALVVAIQDGAKVDERSARDGMTALMVAAWYEQLDCVSALLFNKADPNIRSRTGMTALMIAAGRGHKAITEQLLERGADANAASHFGATPLTFAATTGAVEVVDALIEAKANLNYQDPNGASPLMLAASKGHVAVVKALLIAGADRTLKDKDGFDVEAVARATRHPEVVPVLAETKPVDSARRNEANPAAPQPKRRTKPKSKPAGSEVKPAPFESEPYRPIPEDLRFDSGEPPPGWRRYDLTPTKVTLALPAEPERDDTPTETPLGRAICHDLNVEHDGLDYYFSYAAYPESAAAVDDETFFAQLARYALFDGTHRQVAPARRYRFGGLKARSVQYDSTDPQGKSFTTWLRLVRDGRVAYVLAVNARRGALDFERARDFFRTVRLPEPGTKPPPTAVVADSATWTTYTSKPHGFRVEFPAKPKGDEVNAGALLETEIVEADLGPAHYRVFVSRDRNAAEARRDFDEAVANTQSLGKSVVSDRSIALGTWSAREFVTRDPGETPPVLKRVRFLHNDSYYVSLSVTSPEPNDDPARASRFLSSFRAAGLEAPTGK